MWKLLLLALLWKLQQRLCHCQEFAYFRCNNVTKTLQFVYIGDLSFYDIYAETRSSTCGLRAGVITGKGVFGDPYILEINLSGGLQTQQPDCGVKQSADTTVNLVMIKQKTCEANSITDQRYVSNCKITLPQANNTALNGVATYYCMAPTYIKFMYQQATIDLSPPADIYAISRRSTCSKSAGTGNGAGVDGSPYEMKIDVTNTAADCGVMSTTQGVYSVLIYVQQYPTVLTKFDNTYLLTCNFSANSTITLQSQVLTVISHNPTQVLSQRPTTASLSVVSGAGSVGLSSFYVGDQIRLVAQLLDSPATGLRVTSCTASPGQGLSPVIQVLNSQGCSTSPVLVTPFVGQSPTGMVAITGLFNAFKFEQTNTVFFQCNATVCYDVDLRCLGNHCNTNQRRKRDTTEGAVEVLGVTLTVKDNVTTALQDHANDTGTGPSVPGVDKQLPGTQSKRSSTCVHLPMIGVVVWAFIMASSISN